MVPFRSGRARARVLAPLVLCSLLAFGAAFAAPPYSKSTTGPGPAIDGVVDALTDIYNRLGSAATPTSGTGGPTSVSVGTASTVVASAGARTARLSVSVLHASAKVYCTLGATAVAGTGYLVGNMPGVFNFANDAYVPADALNCISDTAATPVTVWSK